MIYSVNVPRALEFYRDRLGFELLEEYRSPETVFYARLRIPGTASTIALHLLEKGKKLKTGGVRLYFEVRALEVLRQARGQRRQVHQAAGANALGLETRLSGRSRWPRGQPLLGRREAFE